METCKVLFKGGEECFGPAEYLLLGIGPVCRDHAVLAIAAGMMSGLTPLAVDLATPKAGDPNETKKLTERIVSAAIVVINADTYKNPVLSREQAVAEGVSELHDAVREYLAAAQPVLAGDGETARTLTQ